MVSQLTKLLCCLTSDLRWLAFSACCKFLRPTLHSTSWYLCDRCVGPVFHPDQSPILLNTGSGDAKFKKVYKVRFKLPISISVSPVPSLDDGTFHKHNLVGAGETIRQSIAWLVGSDPARWPQGFPSDY